MNSLLGKLEKEKIEFVAYANYLILVFEEDSTINLLKKLNFVMNLINDWCRIAELKINTNQTEYMLMFNGKLNGNLKYPLVIGEFIALMILDHGWTF